MDATWCGQCYTRLTEERSPRPAVSQGAPATPPESSQRRDPFWPCPACDHHNAIEADTCAVCGTPFAQLFRDDTVELRPVEPRDALVWSLVFPGLGHRKLGRGLDGLARGVLFAVALVFAVLTGLGASNGLVFAVFALFLIVGIAVYGLTAYEAYRLAQGGDLLVGSRVLLWALVVVIFFAVALLAASAVSSTRQ